MTRLVTRFEALDYMVQLASSKVFDYVAGIEMLYVSQGSTYGGAISAMVEDTDNIYVAGATTQKIYKYDKATLTKQAESATYSGTINCLAINSTHIFAGGATTNRVRRYLKTDLTYVNQSNAYGSAILAVAADDTYCYFSYGVNLLKVLVGDLTYLVTSTGLTGNINLIKFNGTDLYVADGGTFTRRNTTTLVASATAAAYGGNIRAASFDDSYAYIGGETTKTIQQLNIGNLSLVTTSPDYGGSIWSMENLDAYIYVGGATTNKINRYLKNTLEYVDQSPSYGGIIYAMALDSDFIYIGGATTNRPRKYSIFSDLEAVIDGLLAYPMQLPAVTKGTIENTYGDLIRPIQASGQTILQVLLDLQGILGGYLDVDNDRLLNWVSTIGEDKGQQIRVGKNMLGIKHKVDYTKLVNRFYAYGQDETGRKIRLSEVQANDYVEDAASQTTWKGVFVGSEVNFSITTPEALLEWANARLAETKDPPVSYEVNSIDLSPYANFDFEELQLGSIVKVIDEDLNIEVDVQVIQIEHPDMSNPQNMKLVLSTVAKNAASELATLSSGQQEFSMLLNKG